MANPKQKPDVYTQITNQIIAAIEKGAGEFQMPWHRSGQATMSPVNIDTGNAYRGINIVSLWAAAEIRGFGIGTWGTYRQWQNKGCQVRKGEKASLVVFYKELTAEAVDDDAGEDKARKRLMARASYVFNAQQVDGYEPAPLPVVENPVSPIAQADAFITASGADIRHGGDRAFYRPSDDIIQMPNREAFHGSATSTPTESYYSTLLHELVHFSGHSSRCDRLGSAFDKDEYAREELVAEIGAAFLCAELGVTLDPRPDHAAYIEHWLRILREDNKAIFRASSAAAKAVDFLKGLES